MGAGAEKRNAAPPSSSLASPVSGLWQRPEAMTACNCVHVELVSSGWLLKVATRAGRVTSRSASPLLPRIGHELQHVAVDAVALVGGRRAVVEDVAEVDAGTGAAHFDALHAVVAVFMQADGAFHRVEEAGPAGAAFELGVAAEQGRAGDGVDKGAGALFVQVRSGEGALGALLEGDLLLRGGQQLKAQPLPEGGLVAAVAGVAGDFTGLARTARWWGWRTRPFPVSSRWARWGSACCVTATGDCQWSRTSALNCFAERAVLRFEHHQLPLEGQGLAVQSGRGLGVGWRGIVRAWVFHAGAAQAAIALGIFLQVVLVVVLGGSVVFKRRRFRW